MAITSSSEWRHGLRFDLKPFWVWRLRWKKATGHVAQALPPIKTMIKINNILCPVDFSEFSNKAVDYACSLARRYEARLYLQHVIDPLTEYYGQVPSGLSQQYYKESREKSENELRKLVGRGEFNGFKPEFVIEVGSPAQSILQFSERESTDLIVMGTHGFKGVDRLMMGSVTEKVLRKAHCPVLAVRKPLHDFVAPKKKNDCVQLHKILLATDFSDTGQRAFAYALSLAMEYNAELTLLHVLEEVPRDEELATVTARLIHKLEAFVPADAPNWCSIRSVIRVGKPYQEIVQLALESQTDLIVLGVRGRSTPDLAVFGSTTYRVLQLGSAPVLAVHIDGRAGQS